MAGCCRSHRRVGQVPGVILQDMWQSSRPCLFCNQLPVLSTPGLFSPPSPMGWDDELSEEEHLCGQGQQNDLGGGEGGMWWYPSRDLPVKVSCHFSLRRGVLIPLLPAFPPILRKWLRFFFFFFLLLKSWRVTNVCVLAIKSRNVNNKTLCDIFHL